MRKSLMLTLCFGTASCIAAQADVPADEHTRDGSGGWGAAAESGGGTGDAATGTGMSATGSSSGGAGSTGSGMPEPCPAGIVCVTSFPFSHTSTTTGAASNAFDVYSCSSANESGPEVIYRIDVPSDGFLFLNLPPSGIGAGADIDIHLLRSLDANDCIDRGDAQVGEFVTAGSYYAIADTFVSSDGVSADGAYTLEIGLTTVADLTGWGMSPTVASSALHVFSAAWDRGQVETSAFAVVDFALHAAERRMWVFDVFNASLRHQTYTTVGEGTDPDGDGWADVFSNQSGSNMSSLGLMKCGELYAGTYGPSMRLDGLEPGYNDNVRSRTIVVHAWDGSTQSYVNAFPNTGAAPTWGCFGVDPGIIEDVRSFLGNGGLLLSRYPDGDWSQSSSYLP